MRLEESAPTIDFVYGSGKRKSQAQKELERLSGLLERWNWYEKSLSIMGAFRNSYSKTDLDATFVCLKEEHMCNGQLEQYIM